MSTAVAVDTFWKTSQRYITKQLGARLSLCDKCVCALRGDRSDDRARLLGEPDKHFVCPLIKLGDYPAAQKQSLLRVAKDSLIWL